MPELYTLRAPKNFNSTNNHRSTTAVVQNNRKPEMYYLKSNDHKRTPTYDLLKPVTLPIHSNHRVAPVPANTKRKSPILYQSVQSQKAEMYHLDTRRKKTPEYDRQSPSAISIHQKSKSNGILPHPNSSFPKKVTTYMITSFNEDHFLPRITRTPSPLMRPTKNKRLVTFDTNNHNDKYEILNKQRDLSIESHRLLLMTPSKATDSIHRSMNIYRFRKN